MFTETAHKQMGTLIRKAREGAGLTQAALAKKLGYKSPQFCSNWERARSLPPFAALPKIAKATNTKYDKFADILVHDLRQVLRHEGRK